MSDEEQVRQFLEHTLRMIEPLCLDTHERDLVALSLRYGYSSGYRDCDALWTIQQIMRRKA